MFSFLKAADKNETNPSEEKSKFEVARQEAEALSVQAKDHKRAEKVAERGKFLKLGSHKVTGEELNVTAEHFDDAFIQTKKVQAEMLGHIIQLYQALDALDAEHVTGILSAIKAAETATDWARINDENIGKITSYLLQDDQVVAKRNEHENKITALENKLKVACLVAGGAIVIAVVSLVLCLIPLL